MRSNKFWPMVFRVTVLCFTLLVTMANDLAGGKGTIKGTISDSSDAIIPGAEIKMTQGATSAKETQKSTGAGFYAISSLDPGTFEVWVATPGFQRESSSNWS